MTLSSTGNTVVQVADFDHLPDALRQEFIELRMHFLAGISKRWQEIEFPASSEERVQALHRLVGAASSYGFSRLGKAAREAELSLKTGAPKESSETLQNLKIAIGELVP